MMTDDTKSFCCGLACLVGIFLMLLITHEVIECVMWLDPTATWCDFE